MTLSQVDDRCVNGHTFPDAGAVLYGCFMVWGRFENTPAELDAIHSLAFAHVGARTRLALARFSHPSA